jgi:hypothetical protein
MLTLFRNGGWSMFVIVLFGFVTLATAAFFATRPDKKHEGFIKWMSRATLWATLCGAASDLAATLYFTTSIVDANERARTIEEGFAESMSPFIMGFAMLALAALLAAVGRRRLDAKIG